MLFWELKRVIDMLHEIAGSDISARHIVEHVLMDKEPEDIISEQMGGRPATIPAGPVCASNRDRPFLDIFHNYPSRGGSLEQKISQKRTYLKA